MNRRNLMKLRYINLEQNVINSRTKTVHASKITNYLLCTTHVKKSHNYKSTDKKVTCKRCLKILNSFWERYDRKSKCFVPMESFDENKHTEEMIGNFPRVWFGY
jgi:hypothetical protein